MKARLEVRRDWKLCMQDTLRRTVRTQKQQTKRSPLTGPLQCAYCTAVTKVTRTCGVV